jgi:hypothetical protein
MGSFPKYRKFRKSFLKERRNIMGVMFCCAKEKKEAKKGQS